jgi:hypothetical protein
MNLQRVRIDHLADRAAALDRIGNELPLVVVQEAPGRYIVGDMVMNEEELEVYRTTWRRHGLPLFQVNRPDYPGRRPLIIDDIPLIIIDTSRAGEEANAVTA